MLSEQIFVGISGLACWLLAAVICTARPRPRWRTALALIGLLASAQLLLAWVATLPAGSHGRLWTAAAWAMRAGACAGLLRTGQRKFSRAARYALPTAFSLVLAGGAWALWTYEEPDTWIAFQAAAMQPGGEGDERGAPSLSAEPGERDRELPEGSADDGAESGATMFVVSRELKRSGLAILPIAAFVLIIFGLSRLPQFR